VVAETVATEGLGVTNLFLSVLVRWGESCDSTEFVNQAGSAHIVIVSQ
jgi:hypothetical protein